MLFAVERQEDMAISLNAAPLLGLFEVDGND
jgi:hypothetical protein